ncbi:hypothetical protein HZA57_05810 [Candidatus Poribacteria bacterium]|nr:hypothetical protein [Candidatus Poribacteria bacterium]
MRVSCPVIRQSNSAIRLSARIHSESAPPGFPGELWFEYPRALAPFVQERADPFATALIHVAMATGEPLELEGPVSPLLLLGLAEIVRLFTYWEPTLFQAVEIRAHDVRPGQAAVAGNIGMGFSGGVDSFHTLWQNLHESPERSARITHGRFVHGFDLPLGKRRLYESVAARYEPALAELGVQLVRARTNVREVTRSVEWRWTHGGALAAAARGLSGLFPAFLISSSRPYSHLVPWGSDPRVDGWYSSGTLRIIHDGTVYSRFERIGHLTQWPVTRDLLRPCYRHEDLRGRLNCCRCSTCLYTMAWLEILGMRTRYSNAFPLGTDRRRLRGMVLRTPSLRLAGRQAIRLALRKRMWRQTLDLSCGMAWSYRRVWVEKAKGALPVRWRKALGRLRRALAG